VECWCYPQPLARWGRDRERKNDKPQAIDTSAIQRLIRGTRFRIRAQWALEGATTATVLASALALVSIFAVRTQAIAPACGLYLLLAAGALIVIGAVVAAMRRLDDEVVARRIDRASNLADRLSTAISFERVLAGDAPADPDQTHELMQAAIRDGVRAAPRANIRAAAPFAPPKDLRVALGFLAISALAAGLSIPTTDHTPHLLRANPDHGRPGSITVIEGTNLMTNVTAPPLASMPVRSSLGAPNVPDAAVAPDTSRGYVPSDTTVTLGSAQQAIQITVLDWSAHKIRVRIPDDAPIGPTELHVYVDNKTIGNVEFTVVSKKDAEYQDEKAVALDPDEKAYVEAILAELKNIAQRDKVPELDEFAKKIEQLLDKAENGEITKEQLLEALSKAEDAMRQGEEPNEAEVKKQMADMGKELQKSDVTKELGQALEKNDLEKAKAEMEKLAEKLDKKELSEKQKEDLQKQLEKVAKEMEKQDKDQEKKTDQQQEKVEKEIRRLEKQKQEAKTEQQKQEMERRLEEKKRELDKLKKEEEKKEQSEQRRAVKRLQKDMEKAAENLQKPQKKPGDKDDEQEQGEKEKEASRNLKDAAREMKSWFLPCLLNGSLGPLLPRCLARRIASRRSSICDPVFFCAACLR
jgi:hypothetical protein